MNKRKANWPRLLWLGYLLIMLWLLFLQRQPRFLEAPYLDCLRTGYELEPFRGTWRYLYIARHDSLLTAVIYLGGNVLCFVPLGFGLPCRHEKLRRFGPLLLAAAGIIAAIELTQFFTTLGVCDIDDLIFNLAGTAMGYCLWSLPVIQRHLRRGGWMR